MDWVTSQISPEATINLNLNKSFLNTEIISNFITVILSIALKDNTTIYKFNRTIHLTLTYLHLYCLSRFA